jgi:hypothetical protein
MYSLHYLVGTPSWLGSNSNSKLTRRLDTNGSMTSAAAYAYASLSVRGAPWSKLSSRCQRSSIGFNSGDRLGRKSTKIRAELQALGTSMQLGTSSQCHIRLTMLEGSTPLEFDRNA